MSGFHALNDPVVFFVGLSEDNRVIVLSRGDSVDIFAVLSSASLSVGGCEDQLDALVANFGVLNSNLFESNKVKSMFDY